MQHVNPCLFKNTLLMILYVLIIQSPLSCTSATATHCLQSTLCHCLQHKHVERKQTMEELRYFFYWPRLPLSEWTVLLCSRKTGTQKMMSPRTWLMEDQRVKLRALSSHTLNDTTQRGTQAQTCSYREPFIHGPMLDPNTCHPGPPLHHTQDKMQWNKIRPPCICVFSAGHLYIRMLHTLSRFDHLCKSVQPFLQGKQ